MDNKVGKSGKMNKGSRILIVGHDDIIDSSLFCYFKANDYKNVFSSARYPLDTTCQEEVNDFFEKQGPEYVFLASTRSGGIEANQKFGAEFIYHNLASQNNIIEASSLAKVKKLVFYGSSCVYPKVCHQPMKPEFILTGKMEETSEPYSIAKAAGIKMCQAYKRQYGLNAIVIIPATVYGPQSNTDIERAHVIGALINKFHCAVKDNSAEVVVWGTGKPRREFIFADDLVRASLFLMESYVGEEVVNVGTGSDITIKELAEKIAKVCGFTGKIVFDRTKPDGTMQKLLDNSRLKDLRFDFEVGLEEGLRKTYKWFLKNR